MGQAAPEHVHATHRSSRETIHTNVREVVGEELEHIAIGLVLRCTMVLISTRIQVKEHALGHITLLFRDYPFIWLRFWTACFLSLATLAFFCAGGCVVHSARRLVLLPAARDKNGKQLTKNK